MPPSPDFSKMADILFMNIYDDAIQEGLVFSSTLVHDQVSPLNVQIPQLDLLDD